MNKKLDEKRLLFLLVGIFICLLFISVIPQVNAAITSTEGNDWAEVEMDWFAKTRHGGAGGFRASIGIDPTTGPGQNGWFPGGWKWVSGTTYHFTVDFDSTTNVAELFVTGQNSGNALCTYTVGSTSGGIGINARTAPEAGMTTTIENIEFNGLSVNPDDSITSTSLAGESAVRHLLIDGADLTSDFTLEGDFTFIYSSTTSDERPSMVINFGQITACEPDIPVISGWDPDATCLNGARWRNFRTDGNGWELAVGENIGTYGEPWSNVDFVYAGDYYFMPNGPNTFTYSYDAGTGDQTIEANVNGGLFTTVQNNGNLGNLNYLQFDVVGRNGQTVKFNNVMLTADGMTYSLCNYEAGGWLSWYIDSIDLSNGFSITGEVFLEGQATSQEGSKINICVGSSCTPICRNVEDNIEYCTIQGAIDAATTTDGETIEIYAGTHVEQVEVYKELTIYGQGIGTTTIQSPDTLVDFFPTGSNSNYPVVYIHHIDGVELYDLTVDGAGKGNANYRFVGVGIYEAGATIHDVEVINIQDNPFSGAQHGVAIYGWSDGTGIPHTIILENCDIYDYQKTGIALGGSDLTVDINNCVVTGVGPTTVTAQNGIQVSYGAIGSITENTISGCSYTGPSWAASGILPYLAGGVLDISDNIISENQANIYLCACSADITGNTVTASAAGTGQTYFYGIIGDPGDPPIIPDADPIDPGSPPLDKLTYVINCMDNVVTGDGTSGGVGIGVYAGMYGTYDIDFTANYNDVFDWGVGFELYEYAPNELISADINYNNIVGNDYGIYNWLTTTFNAQCNWWGDPLGPNMGGDTTFGPLILCPWLDDMYPYGNCEGGVICENIDTGEKFCCIQCAIDDIDTLNGHTIQIYPGTHVEQVEVYKSLTLIGDGIGSTTIQSPDTLVDSFTTSNTNYPVVYIHDVDDVVIKDLTVDGAGKGNANYRFVGIGIYQAGATVTDVEVINVQDTPFSGSQHGVAIYGWSDGTGISHDILIDNCAIYDYQKNGITLGGSDLTVDVSDCDVTAAGPTTVTAQNGIQISSDATGSITGNNVTGCSYTGGYWAASGILPLSAGYIDISENILTDNQVSIYLIEGSADISDNMITASVAGTGLDNFYGIIGDPGDPPVIPDADPLDDTTPPTQRMTYVINCIGNDLIGDGSSTDSIGIGVYAGIFGLYDIEFSAMNNQVLNWGTGFELYEYDPGLLTSADINYNNIVGNDIGINNFLETTFDATCNWYGTPLGPTHPSNPSGTGDSVSDYLDYLPWLNLPFEDPLSICGAGLCQDVVYVDDDYTTSTPGYYVDHFSTLQLALDRLSPDGTAYVADGVYSGEILIDDDFCDNTGITIMGDYGCFPGDVSAVINGNLEVLVDGVTIQYLEFNPDTDGSILVGSDVNMVTVECCKFNKDCIADAVGISADSALVEAELNWWGAPDGPSGGVLDDGGVADGFGVKVFGDVHVEPWVGIHAEIVDPVGTVEVEVDTPVSFDGSDSWAYSFGDCCEPTLLHMQFEWNFGDGTYSHNMMASHVFETPGTYQVSLRLDSPGIAGLYSNVMYDWDYVTVHVVQPDTPLTASADGPGLDGGYETLVGESVQLFGDAFGGDGSYSWSWDFGDNSAYSTDQNPSHVYTAPGTYTVTLSVTSGGESATDTAEVVVYDIEELVVDVGRDLDAIVGDSTMFSVDVMGGKAPYEFVWSFGDGSTSSNRYPVHVYDRVGEYTVKVVVTDADGKSRIDTMMVMVVEDTTVIEEIEIVDVSGGFGLSAVIASGDFTVDWEIGVDGLVFVGGVDNGHLGSGMTQRVRLPLTLGFGQVTVTVTANDLVEEYSAFLVGPFFLGLQHI